MSRLHTSAALPAIIITICIVLALPARSNANGEEPWKQELADICSKTDEAMSFTNEQLKVLLQRGGKLRPLIEALEETPRKVHLKRLKKCMDLYSFVIEAKGGDSKLQVQ